MTDWEYCALVSHAADGPDGEPGWRCRLTYFTPEGAQTIQLKEPSSNGVADVFERAMAQLGAGGWELVSLQHELVRNNLRVEGPQYLAAIHTGYGLSAFGAAYFKRPRQPERPIDVPRVAVAGEEMDVPLP
ncbi:MAG TPA: hypothetical protein VFN57_14150 [Thermomicrobiaceae bacterium]|nr:hypothetical protein [Thermomicrobiaceae bacterium]